MDPVLLGEILAGSIVAFGIIGLLMLGGFPRGVHARRRVA